MEQHLLCAHTHIEPNVNGMLSAFFIIVINARFILTMFMKITAKHVCLRC